MRDPSQMTCGILISTERTKPQRKRGREMSTQQQKDTTQAASEAAILVCVKDTQGAIDLLLLFDAKKIGWIGGTHMHLQHSRTSEYHVPSH